MTRICGKNSPGWATASLGWRAAASLCLAWSFTGLVMAAAGEEKPDEEKKLIENGSFEAIERSPHSQRGTSRGGFAGRRAR